MCDFFRKSFKRLRLLGFLRIHCYVRFNEKKILKRLSHNSDKFKNSSVKLETFVVRNVHSTCIAAIFSHWAVKFVMVC